VRQRDPLWSDPAVALRVVALRDDEVRCDVWRAPPATRRGPRLPGVCGILLAAGLGSRFASNLESKLLARWRGRPLIDHVVGRWCAAGFAETLLVVGHARAAIEARAAQVAPRHARLRVVRNLQYRRGLGSSVRAAARGATPGMAMLFGHADMPAIRTQTLRRIADVGLRLRHRIVVPERRGDPGNPVYFPPALRQRLHRASDHEGGRGVYRAQPALVFRLDLGSADDMRDVDRVDDLRRL